MPLTKRTTRNSLILYSLMLPELAFYLTYYAEQHRILLDWMRTLPPEALNWRPIADAPVDDDATNSVAGLAVHMAGAEKFLIGTHLAKRDIPRDRDGEFRATLVRVDDVEPFLVDSLNLITDVFNTLDPVQLEASYTFKQRPVTGRWFLARVATHNGEHLGHAQLTAQLWKAKNGR